jgi:hypothetical protein
MVIISRKGVYIGHSWERIAFSLDTFKTYRNQDSAFKRTVKDGLERGIPEKEIREKGGHCHGRLP